MKVAVIGRGFGSNAIAPVYAALGCAVEIVPSRDVEAVLAACRSADMVSVHSPPFRHLDHVLAAIDAGKPVLCDKPFGRNADDARAMWDAAEQAGVANFLNFQFRAGTAWRKARDLIADGAIGTPRHFHFASVANFLAGRDYGWLHDAALGGGWLGALGSHIVDGVRWLLGTEIVSCGGLSRIDVPFRADGQGGQVPCSAEDAFAIWLKLESGATATIEAASSASVVLPRELTILGSEGALRIVDDARVTLNRTGADPETFDCSSSGVPALHAWLAEVVAAASEGRGACPDFSDGLATAIVLQELKRRMVRA